MFGIMPRRREPTALTRREYSPFDLFNRELASFFELPRWFFRPEWELEPWGFETEELENEMVLRAEIPGFEPGEIEVTMRDNELTVRAEHTEPGEGEVKERRHARVVRTMTLPTGLNLEKIEAKYHNGVLEIHVPRIPEAKPRQIEVKT